MKRTAIFVLLITCAAGANARNHSTEPIPAMPKLLSQRAQKVMTTAGFEFIRPRQTEFYPTK